MKLTKVCSCANCGGDVTEAAVRVLNSRRLDRAYCMRCATNPIRAMYRMEDRRHKYKENSDA